jgi:hypothetical protein
MIGSDEQRARSPGVGSLSRMRDFRKRSPQDSRRPLFVRRASHQRRSRDARFHERAGTMCDGDAPPSNCERRQPGQPQSPAHTTLESLTRNSDSARIGSGSRSRTMRSRSPAEASIKPTRRSTLTPTRSLPCSEAAARSATRNARGRSQSRATRRRWSASFDFSPCPSQPRLSPRRSTGGFARATVSGRGCRPPGPRPRR